MKTAHSKKIAYMYVGESFRYNVAISCLSKINRKKYWILEHLGLQRGGSRKAHVFLNVLIFTVFGNCDCGISCPNNDSLKCHILEYFFSWGQRPKIATFIPEGLSYIHVLS